MVSYGNCERNGVMKARDFVGSIVSKMKCVEKSWDEKFMRDRLGWLWNW